MGNGMADLRGTRVLVALSGGVDSAVCVRLLQERGCDVRAAVMKMSDLHDATVAAAQEAADALGIPLAVLDLRREFEAEVIDYFVGEYLHGRTPNPCVVCNPKIKFRFLMEEADRQSCAFAATGHYARIRKADGAARLYRAASLKRDQSYMLYRLTQRELSRLLLPLGDMDKPEVRAIAEREGLSCANAPDSQENCFIADNDYAAFIRNKVGAERVLPGELVAPDGTVCGQHTGIIDYTVGQRKGLGVALGRPVFVREIDTEQNRVLLADAGQDHFCEAVIDDVTTSDGLPLVAGAAQAKIRSAAVPVPVQVEPLGEKRAHIFFDEPQRAVAKGQSIVLYDGDLVLGGGFIE